MGIFWSAPGYCALKGGYVIIKSLMLKQKVRKMKILHRNKLTSGLVAILVVTSAIIYGGFVYADSISDQINNLQAQNAQNQQNVNALSVQADNYQDAINKLDAQINTLQQQIVANQNKEQELQQQITQAQTDLDKQRKTLGENIKAMYLEGDISTLEILASSNNLSDFVNKQTYRNAVQDKIRITLDKINALKQQLVSQKNAVDALLAQQQSIRAQLANDVAQQSQMLAYTEGQKAAYTQQIKANNSKIAALIAQQIRANNSTVSGGIYFLRFPGPVSPHDPNSNDYPYAGAAFSMNTAPGCVDNDGPDRWGYCTRQCVSYTAWAVERSGRSAPMYYGNAKDWVAAARNDGIPVYTSNPQPGDVAISTAGTWGHSMYVEAVSGNQILVSQYNHQLTGQYSTQWRSY